MISIVTKERQRVEYLAYDLEWVPGAMTFRMCGVFDGEEYRCYDSLEAFIDGELTDRNRGKWFYAHAGGLADFQFVAKVLAQLGYYVRGSTSGSSMIIAHVSRPVWCPRRGKYVAGRGWHFVDSYWLLRDSLRNIGRWVGISKGNVEQSVDWYRTAPWAELRDYNEIDCRILYNGIRLFAETLWDLGGQLKMTQASCAMDLFRRKFLTVDVATSKVVNLAAREAYFASRVEVMAIECRDAYYYDINSSFPYAMTHEMPGELVESRTRPVLPSKGPFIAEVDVEVPDVYLPSLPKRSGNRLFFPTGRWKGLYSDVDLGLLEQTGGRITRVYRWWRFIPNWDLKTYSEFLYNKRKVSDGFPKLAYKYLLNSLYGKFGESDVKSEVVLNPPSLPEDLSGWQMTVPGIYTYDKVVPVPHMHVPIAVQVTAVARKTLYDYMSRSTAIHYCDTDGFSTHTTYEDSNELGGLKLEKHIEHGTFLQAKLYCIKGTDADGKPLSTPGDPDGAGHLVKAKGFSRITLAKFEQLRNGDEIEYSRMVRFKENVRKGDLTPRETQFSKGINQSAIGKRFFESDGTSRPWTATELESFYGTDKKPEL